MKGMKFARASFGDQLTDAIPRRFSNERRVRAPEIE
jgi:hypothetical protein